VINQKIPSMNVILFLKSKEQPEAMKQNFSLMNSFACTPCTHEKKASKSIRLMKMFSRSWGKMPLDCLNMSPVFIVFNEFLIQKSGDEFIHPPLRSPFFRNLKILIFILTLRMLISKPSDQVVMAVKM